MSKTLNAIVFDIHSQERDAVVLRDYTSDSHTISYKRTAPKRTKDFVGMEKSEVKHTLVDPLTGNILGIQTVTSSIRADVAAAVRSSMSATTVAALNDAAYTALLLDQRLPLAV